MSTLIKMLFEEKVAKVVEMDIERMPGNWCNLITGCEG